MSIALKCCEFPRQFIGCDPVAMLRWQYVRLCMKCVNAFIQAGKAYHNRGGELPRLKLSI